MGQKRMVCIAVLFLMFFNIVHIALAEEEQFGITLDCFDSCKDKTIDSSKDIMLVLTIKNNLDFWVSIGKDNNINAQSVFNIDLENNNLKDANLQANLQTGRKSESHADLLGKRILIKPKTELQVYVPFDTYNQLGGDNRLGDWKIHPELQINNVEFYKNPFDSKPMPSLYYPDGRIFTINSRLTGNILEFKVMKQETKVQVEKSNVIVPEGLLDNVINFINSNLVAAIISGIIVSFISYKYFTRGGKRKR
jgi:hypothetical protein